MSVAPVGLGFVDKGDLCKRRAIDAFNREWKSTKDRQKAYDTAAQSMEACIERLGIVNKGAITGLRAELLYYSMEFDSQKLVPESAAGLHSDFRAIIRNRPAAIDVTTTPDYKDPDLFMQVKQAFGKSWDYYVGVIDLKNPQVQMYPLLLPRCEDGHLGHFVLVIETEDPSSSVSERQMLLRYNPYAPDDDTAVEKVQASWNFIVSNPSAVWDDITSDYSYYEEQDRSRMERFMMRDLLRYSSGLAYEFKQESGFNLSAIVTCEARVFHKPIHEVIWETRLWWVHPHSFVRRILGKPLTDLEHNIAGVAYDL
ncbi:hypothetical protein MUP07_03275 [Candidatus Bathyarchaeota archaeon]|nr:hypothetical protein [Candidatus Bathyarchaeota archaeon]